MPLVSHLPSVNSSSNTIFSSCGSIDSVSQRLRRSQARSSLISTLHGRHLQEPFKSFYRKVTEVGISNYQRECHQLGSPKLFQNYNKLPIALSKKKEKGLHDTIVSTYSYRAQTPRPRHLTSPKRELTISDLHQLLYSNTLGQNEVGHGMQIAITEHPDQSSPIKLTIKKLPIHEHTGNNLTSQELKEKPAWYSEVLHDGFWDDSAYQKRLTLVRACSIKAQHPHELDTISEYLYTDNQPKQYSSKDAGDFARFLTQLEEQSAFERTAHWIYTSPLGAKIPRAVVDENEQQEQLNYQFKLNSNAQQQHRKVRFDSSQWQD